MSKTKDASTSIKQVASAQKYIKAKYGDTIGLATSILGQVLLGTIKGSKRKKEVIKLCLKDMKRQFADRVAENPRMEIEFMMDICNVGHPNFVRYLDAIEDPKLFCICLEYVKGGDMCTYIQNLRTGIGNDKAVKFTTQLCKAVYFMHSKGYCHLDLSLENVLWDKQHDSVKICDFGLCRRFVNGNKDSLFPAACIRPGKKGYMSPEIYAYQKFNGEKADVFSIGVIIFILLTGFPPFNTPNASDKCFQYMYYGKLEWLLKQWKLTDMINSECTNLLSKIFCHPKKRISMKELLEHPWLNQEISEIDTEIASLYNDKIIDTNHTNCSENDDIIISNEGNESDNNAGTAGAATTHVSAADNVVVVAQTNDDVTHTNTENKEDQTSPSPSPSPSPPLSSNESSSSSPHSNSSAQSTVKRKKRKSIIIKKRRSSKSKKPAKLSLSLSGNGSHKKEEISAVENGSSSSTKETVNKNQKVSRNHNKRSNSMSLCESATLLSEFGAIVKLENVNNALLKNKQKNHHSRKNKQQMRSKSFSYKCDDLNYKKFKETLSKLNKKNEQTSKSTNNLTNVQDRTTTTNSEENNRNNNNNNNDNRNDDDFKNDNRSEQQQSRNKKKLNKTLNIKKRNSIQLTHPSSSHSNRRIINHQNHHSADHETHCHRNNKDIKESLHRNGEHPTTYRHSSQPIIDTTKITEEFNKMNHNVDIHDNHDHDYAAAAHDMYNNGNGNDNGGGHNGGNNMMNDYDRKEGDYSGGNFDEDRYTANMAMDEDRRLSLSTANSNESHHSSEYDDGIINNDHLKMKMHLTAKSNSCDDDDDGNMNKI